ncbi:MAG: MaoC family dehydratase N-terminal domain-containing protein [Clostridia bacterium]|nr:MaoC family dehydratase N-terminal domain-containing protein [Clostridia bacterium]
MYFEELKLGIEIDIEPVVIDKQKMIDFAREYDNVPLHTDEEYAKKTHYGKLIAPGVMAFMSVWANYLKCDFFGENLLAGKSTKIEWLKPVFAGDVLSATAKITDLKERNEKNGIAQVTITIYNQNNELVIVDTSETVVKKKGYKLAIND